jgi:hypothetical protein
VEYCLHIVSQKNGTESLSIDPDDSITERTVKMFHDLSDIQGIRNEPLEVITTFAILHPRKFQKCFVGIRPRFLKESYAVEFEYLYTQITGREMTLSMPEVALMGKRALVLKMSFLVPWLTVE